MLTINFPFTNKASYLAWRETWKDTYKDLSDRIRAQKKISLDPNNHLWHSPFETPKGPYAQAERARLRKEAHSMLMMLEKAKSRSWEMKKTANGKAPIA